MGKESGSCSRLWLSVAASFMIVFFVSAALLMLVIKYEDKINVERPNIVMILLDDIGEFDVSWNNGDVKMPALQKLAEDGVILDNHYLNSICSPSRAAMLTGRYSFKTSFQHLVVRENNNHCLPQGFTTLPEELQRAGYKTHLVGKWHLGHCSWSCTPLKRGFDTHYGPLNGFIDHYDHTLFGGYDWWDNDTPDVGNAGSFSTDLLATRAVQLVSSHNVNEPLFLMMAHTAAHGPFVVPQKYLDLYPELPDSVKKSYLALISSADVATKQLLDALQYKGMLDNTIFIFSSDNGGDRISNRGGYRGSKMSIYEGGHRSSAFISGMGIPQSSERKLGLMHATDWFPTILSLAGINIDRRLGEGMDGIDQSQMIKAGVESRRDEIIYNLDVLEPEYLGRAAIRVGKYKYIEGYTGLFDGWGDDVGYTELLDIMTKNRYPGFEADDSLTDIFGVNVPRMVDYSRYVRDYQQLYDLEADPFEKNNIVLQYPELAASLKSRIWSHLGDVFPINETILDPNPEAYSMRDANNKIWIPGWCPNDPMSVWLQK